MSPAAVPVAGGFAATSATNIASGAISGVALDLLQPSAAISPATTPPTYTSTTLTISPDTTSAATTIGTFVTALNGVLSSIQTLTGYNASTQTAGALEGNATLQAFGNQLQNILDTVTSSKSGVASLADIGLTADANTGSIDSDASTLSNALSSNLAAVGQLLGGTNGIATVLEPSSSVLRYPLALTCSSSMTSASVFTGVHQMPAASSRSSQWDLGRPAKCSSSPARTRPACARTWA